MILQTRHVGIFPCGVSLNEECPGKGAAGWCDFPYDVKELAFGLEKVCKINIHDIKEFIAFENSNIVLYKLRSGDIIPNVTYATLRKSAKNFIPSLIMYDKIIVNKDEFVDV